MTLYAAAGLDPVWANIGYQGRLLAVQKEVDAALVAHILDATAKSWSPDDAPPPPTGEASWAPPEGWSLFRTSRNLRSGRDGAGVGEGAAAADAALPSAILDVTVAPFTDYEGIGQSNSSSSSPAIVLLVIAAATFIASGSVITSLLLLILITGEKARKLIGSLRTIGLYESTHVLAWFTAALPFFVVTGLITATVGGATGIAFFTNTEWGIHAIAAMLLMASTGSLIMFCASCVRSTVAVNISAFMLFSATAVITTIFSV